MSYGEWHVPPGFDASAGLLLAAEVAELYRVDVRTVLAWARNGRIPAIRTPGHEWRFGKRWVYTDLGVKDDGQPAAP